MQAWKRKRKRSLPLRLPRRVLISSASWIVIALRGCRMLVMVAGVPDLTIRETF
jgi:hypothetical protein